MAKIDNVYAYIHNKYKISDIHSTPDSDILTTVLQQSTSLAGEYNKIILIKYLYNEIDFFINNNAIFEDYIKFLNLSKIDRELYILDRVECIISGIFNSYKANLFYLNNVENSNIFVSLKSVNMSTHIEDIFLTNYLSTKSREINPYTIYEIRQDITHNITMSVLHRLAFIKVINRSCKNIDQELKSQLFYTKGNVIYLDKKYLPILKKLVVHNRLPTSQPVKLVMYKNQSLYNLIDNNNYSYNVWLETFSNKIDLNSHEFLNLKDIPYDATKLINVLNYLNSTQVSLDKSYYYTLLERIKTSKTFTSTLNSVKNIIKKDVYLYNTDADEYIVTNNNNIDLINLTLLEEELDIFIKFNNKNFYLTYVLDRRSRIYIRQWPINYQLNHLVRAVVTLTNDHITIYRNFFIHKNLHYQNTWGF